MLNVALSSDDRSSYAPLRSSVMATKRAAHPVDLSTHLGARLIRALVPKHFPTLSALQLAAPFAARVGPRGQTRATSPSR